MCAPTALEEEMEKAHNRARESTNNHWHTITSGYNTFKWFCCIVCKWWTKLMKSVLFHTVVQYYKLSTVRLLKLYHNSEYWLSTSSKPSTFYLKSSSPINNRWRVLGLYSVVLRLTFMSEMDSSFCCPLGFFFWKSSIRFLMLVPISPKFKYKFYAAKETKRNLRLTIK